MLSGLQIPGIEIDPPGVTASSWDDDWKHLHRRLRSIAKRRVAHLLLLCSGHHQRHHDGLLRITGRAPDRLVFAWQRDDDEREPARTPSPTWDSTEDAPDS